MSDETPAPRHEVKKLPRITCDRCGITQAKPAMDNGRCRNTAACDKRFNDKVRRKGAREK